MKFCIVILSAILVAANCLPANLGVRPKRQNGMHLNGFYDHNMQDPQQNFNYEGPVQQEGQYAPLPVDQLGPHLEATTQVADLIPQAPQEVVAETLNTKKRPQEDSEEDDEPSWPMFMGMGKGRQQSSYNFFPVMFSGAGLGRSGDAPGGAVAIANSFSTGKKGMANSNAVANGDPTGAFRNANLGRYQQQ